MGRDAIKASENMCFRCRKEASNYDERLFSREATAPLLGVSVSSLAEYETGATKVIPVDKIVLMADLYKKPELKLWYCSEECPIGKSVDQLPSYDLKSVELTTLKLIEKLRRVRVEKATDDLIMIMADGVVSQDEKVDFAEIMAYLDELIKAAGELRLIGSRLLGEEKNHG